METKLMDYTCDILIVDDDDFNLTVAGDILQGEFLVRTAQTGEQALERLETELPRLILLDLHMPGMDGRETMKRIRENERCKKIPIIFLTADSKPETEQECLVLGASDFITKPFVPMVMQSRIRRIMELADLQNDLESRLEEKSKLVEKVSLNAIMTIAHTIDAKDAYTSGHSVRVAKCATAIAEKLGWEESEIQNLHHIALLHDIGKIGVPDAILNKPGKLKDEEFEIIKKHSLIGSEILKDIRTIKNVAEGALYHHERYDGKGYPFGIAGENIPLCARIIGIADAYDAMTSNRIYRRKLSASKVIEELEKGRGSQFDPQLTDLFLEMLREHMEVSGGNYIIWDDDSTGERGGLLNTVLTDDADDIQKEAVTDVLTGIWNRSYAENQIGRLMADGRFGALLLIDIDNFSHVNDTYGHIIGDKVLQLVAETLKVETGPEDVLGRIGGDEFIVFLKEKTDRQELGKKAQDIVDVISAGLHKFKCSDVISVSIGIALCPEDGKNFETLYNNADKALYHMKRNGKNSYFFCSDDNLKGRAQNTNTDLNHIRSMLEGRIGVEQGALKVEYEDLQKIYKHISNGVKQNQQLVQTLLFTLCLDDNDGQEVEIAEAMKTLELAVASSLRMVDVGTQYSSMQYMVILLDADLEEGKKVADSVTKQFYSMFGGQDVTVICDIKSMMYQSKGKKAN